MIRDILTYDIYSDDNPVILRTPTVREFDVTDPEVQMCITDLNDTLDEFIRVNGNRRGASGLSSNQIGYSYAVSAVQLGDRRYIMADPEVTEERGKMRLFRIGCFSLFEYRALYRCNDDITVRYKDENGDVRLIDLQGDRACVVLHEMDHLDGRLLFENLENREKGLFIPDMEKRPASGLAYEIARRLGNVERISTEQRYSYLFNDYTDYREFVKTEAEREKELLKAVREAAPAGGCVRELDCMTGALAAALSEDGYRVSASPADDDLTEMAMRINAACGTDVNCSSQCAGKTDVVFSRRIAVSGRPVKALKEALGAGKTLVFEVPTLDADTGPLLGDERLHTAGFWKGVARLAGAVICGMSRTEDGKAVFSVKSK